jgi:hypothetical protein
MRFHPLRRVPALSLALALGTVAVTGCADRKAEAPAAAPAPGPATVATEMADAPTRADDVPESKETESARMVIRTARIELRAETPAEVVARAIRVAEEAGGFVSGSQASGTGEDIEQTTATLRIPATAFERVLDTLRHEGDLLHESLGGEDVTDQYVDLSARLRSQQTLETRLLEILGKVQTVSETLEVEGQLTRVRTEIERLDAQRRTMEDRVALATVELVVSSPVRHGARGAESVTSKIDRALDDAGSIFIGVVTGLIRIFGALLPLALVFGPIAYALNRGLRRRRTARALAMQAAATRHATPSHPPLG